MEDFRDIILTDFSIYSKFTLNKHEGKFTCKITGSTIQFEGCDSVAKVHGLKQDICFFNEITEMKEEIYNQICQRTSDTVFADYNPSRRFWLDKYQNNPNTIYFKSTYLNNPFLTEGIISKIISYNPDIPINVKQGTADKFMWLVYGLGELSLKPNRVIQDFSRCTSKYYNHLTYKEHYGLDFGTSNPTAIVGIKYDGDRTIFVRQLLYKPSSEMRMPLYEYMRNTLPMITDEDLLVCDSAKRTMVTDLQSGGYNAISAKKGPGSFHKGIATLQSFSLVFTVESDDLIEEAYAYEYKLDRYGLVTDDVEKSPDHLLNSLMYILVFLVAYEGIRL